MEDILSLELRAKTPLQLYFETLILGHQEQFMRAFIIEGFSISELETLNREISTHDQNDTLLGLITEKMKEIGRESELNVYLKTKGEIK